MSVYIVTGKLGSGKTLLACMKAQEYLSRRTPIASNIEFNLENLCRPTNDYSRCIRLPDMPTSDDLLALGMGCDKYDEEKFGAIFLDEAGIWLNSRKWNSSGRIDLLEFFLYLRKRRWDLWLLVQNIDVVDKQIRQAIAEHVVYCSRSDRYQMPFLPKVMLNIFTLGLINFIKMPQFHTAVCKYGVSKLAPNSDVWYYRGVDYYDAYNTMQQFDSEYSSGSYSVLPPFYTLPILKLKRARHSEYLKSLPSHSSSPTKLSKKVMRLTRIYFRKFRIPSAFGVGAFFMLFATSMFYLFVIEPANKAIINQSNEPDEQSASLFSSDDNKFKLKAFSKDSPEEKEKIKEYSASYIKSLRINSYSRYPNGLVTYKFKGTDGRIITEQYLVNNEYTIKKGDRYHATIEDSTGAAYSILRY